MASASMTRWRLEYRNENVGQFTYLADGENELKFTKIITNFMAFPPSLRLSVEAYGGDDTEAARHLVSLEGKYGVICDCEIRISLSEAKALADLLNRNAVLWPPYWTLNITKR